MVKTIIKRKSGDISDLIDSYIPATLETESETIVVKGLFDEFISVLDDFSKSYDTLLRRETALTDRLNPDDLQSFLRRIKGYYQTIMELVEDGKLVQPSWFGKDDWTEHTEENFGSVLGEFLTQCLQISYESGFKNIILDLQGLPAVNCLLSQLDFLDGALEIKVKGNIGYSCCIQSSYINLTVDGTFGNNLGDLAKNCEFIINGELDINSYPSGSVYCKGISNESKNCVYKTTIRDNLTNFFKNVSDGNKIIFVQDNGEEIVLRDK